MISLWNLRIQIWQFRTTWGYRKNSLMRQYIGVFTGGTNPEFVLDPQPVWLVSFQLSESRKVRYRISWKILEANQYVTSISIFYCGWELRMMRIHTWYDPILAISLKHGMYSVLSFSRWFGVLLVSPSIPSICKMEFSLCFLDTHTHVYVYMYLYMGSSSSPNNFHNLYLPSSPFWCIQHTCTHSDCICVCVCTCIYVHMHTFVYAHPYMYMCTCINLRTYLYTHQYMYTHTCIET